MEGLGIDPKLLIAQIVNFLVLLFILNKFLYKPILKFFDERRKKIEEGLLNSQKIEGRLAKIEEQQKEIIRQARLEAARIINESKKGGEQEKEKILEVARQKAKEEVQKGSLLAKQEFAKAKQELRNEAVTLGEAMTKKVIGNLSDDQKRQLIDEALR